MPFELELLKGRKIEAHFCMGNRRKNVSTFVASQVKREQQKTDVSL